jgi:hypothetical protein
MQTPESHIARVTDAALETLSGDAVDRDARKADLLEELNAIRTRLRNLRSVASDMAFARSARKEAS